MFDVPILFLIWKPQGLILRKTGLYSLQVSGRRRIMRLPSLPLSAILKSKFQKEQAEFTASRMKKPSSMLLSMLF